MNGGKTGVAVDASPRHQESQQNQSLGDGWRNAGRSGVVIDARSRFATDEVIEAAKARSIFLTAEFKRGRKAASKRLHEARKYEARPRWADVDAIASIYAECARITRVSGVPHEVDHIIPLLGRGVCGLHVEANLRIVPRHVNRRKSNKLEPVA